MMALFFSLNRKEITIMPELGFGLFGIYHKASVSLEKDKLGHGQRLGFISLGEMGKFINHQRTYMRNTAMPQRSATGLAGASLQFPRIGLHWLDICELTNSIYLDKDEC